MKTPSIILESPSMDSLPTATPTAIPSFPSKHGVGIGAGPQQQQQQLFAGNTEGLQVAPSLPSCGSGFDQNALEALQMLAQYESTCFSVKKPSPPSPLPFPTPPTPGLWKPQTPPQPSDNITTTFTSPSLLPALASLPLTHPSPTSPSTPSTTASAVTAASLAALNAGVKPMDPARPPPASKVEQPTLDPKKYKTQLCRNWLRSNTCAYGNLCIYAHGTPELRHENENAAAVSAVVRLAAQRKASAGPRITEVECNGYTCWHHRPASPEAISMEDLTTSSCSSLMAAQSSSLLGANSLTEGGLVPASGTTASINTSGSGMLASPITVPRQMSTSSTLTGLSSPATIFPPSQSASSNASELSNEQIAARIVSLEHEAATLRKYLQEERGVLLMGSQGSSSVHSNSPPASAPTSKPPSQVHPLPTQLPLTSSGIAQHPQFSVIPRPGRLSQVGAPSNLATPSGNLVPPSASLIEDPLSAASGMLASGFGLGGGMPFSALPAEGTLEFALLAQALNNLSATSTNIPSNPSFPSFQPRQPGDTL